MDTAPIRPDERFDEVRVAAYLRKELPDIVGDAPIRFEQFPGGKANLTYLARAGSTELVLRRPPLGPVAPGAHDMSREYRVLSVLHQAYPRAPRAHVLCEDPDVMGKPFFVMERRTGHVVREAWPEGIGADDRFRRTVGENLVDALAELHLVDHEALGLSDLGRPDGFVGRQVAGWADRWNRAKDHEVPAMAEAARRLAAAVPEPQAATLLHNDFKLDNTMIDERGAIVAVFDWDMSTTGDPLVDVGTTLAYWSGGGVASFAAADAVVLGDVIGPPDIVERYADATGFDLSGIDWYRALGLFRIAVIVQQIYIRWVRGQTRDDRFSRLGEIVPPMAAAAVDLL
ncbi:MAG: phosphotransferase family protein [Actinomycetota bacterium]|nr:phosphotransferase family protein [Actinomycetota bacterium]